MKEYWFERRGGSFMFPIHWKGWVSGIGFASLVLLGKNVDDALRPGDTIVYVAAVAPLCIAVLPLVWVITTKIRREP